LQLFSFAACLHMQRNNVQYVGCINHMAMAYIQGFVLR
jgi:hypothetical protein